MISGIRVKTSFIDSYKEALDNSYQMLNQSDNYSNRISFGIVTVAYIECACNRLIIDFCENTFDATNAKIYAEFFIKFAITAKIQMLVTLVTHYKFIVDRNHNTIQFLIKLIRIRNQIVHKKDYYKEVQGEFIEAADSSTIISVQFCDKHLEQLLSSEATKFYNAALNFVSRTLEEYSKNQSLKEGDFIINNSQKPMCK